MQQKVICHFTSVHKKYDTRIFHKECCSLAMEGYVVYYIVPGAENETKEGVNIVGVETSGNSRFSRMTSTVWRVLKKVKEINADIYHFHDPELIPVGIVLSLLGKNVVYDVHENVPQDILDKEWLGPLFLRRIISFTFSVLEKIATLFFSGMVCVTPEILKRFSAKKSILLRNMPVLKMIDSVPPANETKSKPVIIFSGALTRIRGIQETIKAMELLEGKAELWLMGEWESDSFYNDCKKEKGFEFIRYFGILPQENVYAITKLADVGVVCYLPVANHFSALPNKPFEYMACYVPMVMSNFPFWKETFAGSSLFVDPDSPAEIAKQFNELISNKNLALKLGKEGRRLIETNFSWEAERVNLFNLYKRILEIK